MTRSEKVEFLRAKAALVIGQAANEQAREQLVALFSWLSADAAGTDGETIRRGDRLLQDIFEVFDPDVRKRLDEELLRRFSITRLTKPVRPASAVITRVLQRGTISDDAMAQQIEEVVADTTNISAIGPEAYASLAAMLDSYRSDVTRRPKK
jgi:hypothetical protein